MAISKYAKKLIKERIDEIRPKYDEAVENMSLYQKDIDNATNEHNKWKAIRDACVEEVQDLRNDLKAEARINADTNIST